MFPPLLLAIEVESMLGFQESRKPLWTLLAESRWTRLGESLWPRLAETQWTLLGESAWTIIVR
jgi:hypothetical protein